MCYECLVDDDCRTATSCSSTCVNKQCTQTTPLDCTQNTGNTYCNASNAVCVECLSNSNCSVYQPVCNSSNDCVECVVNADCLSDNDCNATCVGSVCMPGTLNCADSGLRCKNQTSECVQCLSLADCSVQSPYCDVNGTNLCVECLQDDVCRNTTNCNALCSNGLCTDAVSVSNCISPFTGNVFCLISQGTCKECLSSLNCTSGQVCDSGTCANSGRKLLLGFISSIEMMIIYIVL